MLQADGIGATPALQSQVAKAKSVIWLFMIGGTSHMETFDPKPMLTKYAGKTIEETSFAHVLKSPYMANERVVAFDPNNGFVARNSTHYKSAFAGEVKAA